MSLPWPPRLGTSTSVFGGVLDDEQIDALNRSAVTCIEVIGVPADATFGELKQRLKDTRFGINSVHLPFGRALDLSQPDESSRAQAAEWTAAHLHRASLLGAPLAVVHPSAEPIEDAQRSDRLDATRRSLTYLEKAAVRFGMRLAVECLPRTCLGHTASELASIIAHLDPAVIGACIDVNHLNLREPDIAAAVAVLAPRLLTLHCSDNDGEDERHWLPGSPGGVVDWPAFLGALRAAGYAGPFMYEVRSTGIPPADSLRQIEANYRDVIIPAASVAA
jgi:sugar phosphate isomerase/epimerase